MAVLAVPLVLAILVTVHLVGPELTVNLVSEISLSLVMRKPAYCIFKNKDADQLHGDREADQRICFVFATQILRSLYLLYPKFQASTISLLPRSEI